MSNISEIFSCKVFSSKRIFCILAYSKNFNVLSSFSGNTQLYFLSFAKGFNNFSKDSETIGFFGFFKLFKVRGCVFDDYLKWDGWCSISEFNEQQSIVLLESCRVSPSSNCNILVQKCWSIGQKIIYSHHLPNEIFWSVSLREMLRELEIVFSVHSIVLAFKFRREREIHCDGENVSFRLNSILKEGERSTFIILACLNNLFGWLFFGLLWFRLELRRILEFSV